MENIIKLPLDSSIPVVLYGAGQYGEFIFDFLTTKCKIPVYCFCDSNEKAYERMVKGRKVVSIESVIEELEQFTLVISVIKEKNINIIKEKCIKMGIAESNIYDNISHNANVLREYCGYVHIDNAAFFDSSEAEETVSIFWDNTSKFNILFQKLDLTETVEIACGRGRHLPYYINNAKHVVLVDILDKNIEICKKRFKNFSNITYYKNNGYNLAELKSDKYSAVFSYDSFVHFESLDINNYLLEVYRILKKGGMALFHHSNNHTDYKADFTNSIHSRSYMSTDLFAHFSYKAGFEILFQEKIDWYGNEELDAITLLKK